MRKALVFALFVTLAVVIATPTFHDTLRSTDEKNAITLFDTYLMPDETSGFVPQTIVLEDIFRNADEDNTIARGETTGGGGGGHMILYVQGADVEGVTPDEAGGLAQPVEVARDVINEGTGSPGMPSDMCARLVTGFSDASGAHPVLALLLIGNERPTEIAILVGDKKPNEVAFTMFRDGAGTDVVQMIDFARPVNDVASLIWMNRPRDFAFLITMDRPTEVAELNIYRDPDDDTAIDDPSDGDCIPTPIDICIPWYAKPDGPVFEDIWV